VPEHNEEVWGVVFQIDEFDIGNLDKSEGYAPGRKRNAYIRLEQHVYEDGNEKRPISVMTYVVEEKKNDVPPPNDEYKRLIIGGAKYWHLPEGYITKLENIETAA